MRARPLPAAPSVVNGMEIHLRDDDVSPPLPNRLAGPAAAALRRNTGALALTEHDAVLRVLPSIARSYNTSLRDLAVAPRPPNIGIKIVPEKGAVIVERFGKFHTVLNPGIHLLVPVVDQIAYVWHLKEEAIHVANQTAVTKDNVAITIDGVLYLRVVDPVKASYGVENPIYAVSQLAQTTMRSEIGKISLDKTFEGGTTSTTASSTRSTKPPPNGASSAFVYEIRDIVPPTGIKVAMEMQAEAERRKRATVLESEAEREAAVNRAEGQKQKTVLEAEAEAGSTMLAREPRLNPSRSSASSSSTPAAPCRPDQGRRALPPGIRQDRQGGKHGALTRGCRQPGKHGRSGDGRRGRHRASDPGVRGRSRQGDRGRCEDEDEGCGV